MNPNSHSLVHFVACFMGMAGGTTAGFLAGALIAVSLGEGHEWISAIGMAVGIAVGVLGVSWIVRRFVPAHCPSCGSRMKCRIRHLGGDTSYASYVCGACGKAEWPAMARWNRICLYLSGQASKEKGDR
jgi:hypothetical protein